MKFGIRPFARLFVNFVVAHFQIITSLKKIIDFQRSFSLELTGNRLHSTSICRYTNEKRPEMKQNLFVSAVFFFRLGRFTLNS